MLKDKLEKSGTAPISFDWILDNTKEKNNSNGSLKEFCDKYEVIEKDNCCMRLLVAKQKFPVKDLKSNNKLDYNMELFYVLKVVINNESDILEITIDKYNNENDSYAEFDKWLSILNEKSMDEIFDLLLSMV